MKCTMPKCLAEINGWTGLQELWSLQKHFASKHKVRLSLNEAASVRIDIEGGKVPNILSAMLGTGSIGGGR